MASNEERQRNLENKEQRIQQLKNINIEDIELKDLKTQQDFLDALEKAKTEQDTLSSFYKHFDEFNNEAKQGLINTVMKSPSDLKMSDKIKIPTNGNAFPWKNKSDLEKVLKEYKKWLNEKKANWLKEKKINNNDIRAEAKYEFTPKGDLKMTTEELGMFACFLNDNYPLDSTSFMIYVNDAIAKKIKKNKLRNKILSYTFTVFRIALTLLSALLFVFTGGLSALGIPPLKALTSVDAVSGAISLTSKGKALQKACAIGGYMSIGTFIAPMFINATNEYFINDKDQTKNRQQLLKNELEARVKKLQEKINLIENKVSVLAAQGQNMPEVNKKIKEIQLQNNQLQGQLKQEKETNSKITQQQIQQNQFMMPQNLQNNQMFIPQQPNMYPVYGQQIQQNNQFPQQQNGFAYQNLPQNTYQQYNQQTPINNQPPINLNQVNQQNIYNPFNNPQTQNNLQQNQTQQPFLNKDTTSQADSKQNNTNDKPVDEKNANDILQKLMGGEKNEKQNQKENQQNNKTEKNKQSKTKINQNDTNLYNKNTKQNNNKVANINKKITNKEKTGKINNI